MASPETTRIMDDYQASHKAPEWPRPPELTEDVSVTYRNRTARKLSRSSPEEIVRAYTGLSTTDLRKHYASACRHLLHEPLEGVGIELGSGCGVLSCLVAERPEVEVVLGVECVDDVAQLLAVQVAHSILGEGQKKFVPVIGSFDDIQLPSDSVDFAVEFDSLHHSPDLERTLRELQRILKPGGRLLAFDRVHPDSVTDQEVKEMLDKVYPPDFLEKYGYPPGLRLTRRENGEHEYRLFEFETALSSAGLSLLQVRKTFEERNFARGLAGLLPNFLSRRVSNLPAARFRDFLVWAAQPLLLRSGRYIPGKSGNTVLLARKPL